MKKLSFWFINIREIRNDFTLSDEIIERLEYQVNNRLNVVFGTMIFIFTAIFYLGCGNTNENQHKKPKANPKSQLPIDIPRQEVFVLDQIFRYSVVENFNLWMPGPPSPTRQGLIMDTLWYIDQETGKQVNALAIEPPIYSEDFRKMTVKLRPGVYWSDGVEFSAEDLVFTVNNLKSNLGMNWSTELDLFVEKANKLDKYTVVFELKIPNPRFHYYFEVRYNAIWMQPKHIWENVSDPMTFRFNNPLVSLGAYEYADSDPSGYWELFKRREDWQRTTAGILTGKAGPPYIMSIFYGGSERKAMAMGRHELDLFMNVDYEAFQSILRKTPKARSWYKSFPWAYPNELTCRYFGFNLGEETVLENKDVRWALTLALDIVDLQTEYIGGVARVTALPQPATPKLMNLYHDPMESWLKSLQIKIGDGELYHPYDDTIPEQIAKWARMQGYTVPTDAEELRLMFGTGWWKHDPKVAEKLLLKNGFARNSDGKWLKPDGKLWTVSMIVAPDEVDIYRLAIGAQDQWAEFGLKLELETLQRDPYSTREYMGEFEATSSWGNASAGDVTGDKWQAIFGLHSRFYTPVGKSTAGNGSNNILRIKSKEMDHIIDELDQLHPKDPRSIELGQSFMKLWLENMYSIVTISFKKFVTIDEHYWTGFPTSENPFTQPLYWFGGGRFTLQHLTPVDPATVSE